MNTNTLKFDKANNAYFYTSSGRPITVCARIDESSDQVIFGVTRKGLEEKTDERRAAGIALHRTEIQPYSFSTLSSFGKSKSSRQKVIAIMCEGIVSHIRNSKQWQPKLRRLNR